MDEISRSPNGSKNLEQAWNEKTSPPEKEAIQKMAKRTVTLGASQGGGAVSATSGGGSLVAGATGAAVGV